MNTRQTFLNNNQLIIGGSGTGKTRYLIKPNLFQEQDYANEQFVEEYQPSEEDLTNNIDDFIESLQPARSVDFTKEERGGFDDKKL